MKEYLTSVIAVAAICAIIDTLSPDGKMKKSVSFALSLAVTLALLSPLSFSISGIKEKSESFISEIESAYDGAYSNSSLEYTTSEAANEGIKEAISGKFGIDKSNIEAKCKLNIIGETVVFEKVEIFLYGKGIFADTVGIKKYVSESLGCECEVKLLDR